jgi:hypothetical protein
MSSCDAVRVETDTSIMSAYRYVIIEDGSILGAIGPCLSREAGTEHLV